jgi:hypothetical protein
MHILAQCLDYSRLPSGFAAGRICDRLSTPDDSTEQQCVHLSPFLGTYLSAHVSWSSSSFAATSNHPTPSAIGDHPERRFAVADLIILGFELEGFL